MKKGPRRLRRTFPDVLKVILPGIALCLCSLELKAASDVEFSGTLVAAPCVVATDSEEQTVNFGSIAAKAFINNDRSNPESFQIRLEECDLSMGSQVVVTFNGVEDADQPGTFTVEGAAKGIAVVLEDSKGRAILPNESLASVEISAGETVLEYRAQIKALAAGRVKEGDFTSNVTFMLEYE